jgi:hypothetical protein
MAEPEPITEKSIVDPKDIDNLFGEFSYLTYISVALALEGLKQEFMNEDGFDQEYIFEMITKWFPAFERKDG